MLFTSVFVCVLSKEFYSQVVQIFRAHHFSKTGVSEDTCQISFISGARGRYYYYFILHYIIVCKTVNESNKPISL